MNKIHLTIGIIAVVAVSSVIFISSRVKQPAVKVNDTGSTPEGVNAVVKDYALSSIILGVSP